MFEFKQSPTGGFVLVVLKTNPFLNERFDTLVSVNILLENNTVSDDWIKLLLLRKEEFERQKNEIVSQGHVRDIIRLSGRGIPFNDIKFANSDDPVQLLGNLGQVDSALAERQ